jgi:predicted transcriptional regulator
MSKAVLISIQPKWVEKIANGEKTIEVRKTKPKLEMPFKVYIYCTKGKPTIFESDGLVNGDIPYFYNGFVMGEFVCDKITDISVVVRNCNENYNHVYHNDECKGSCLTWKELQEYGKGKPLYGWHISALKIYDKPKELSEFWTVKCTNKKGSCVGCEVKPNCIKTITRPPQSWCYVEELK